MDDFLEKFVQSYEIFTATTNSVCYLIFAVAVFLLSRRIGILSDGTKVAFARPSLLLLCIFLCAVTFVFNFLIHGTIARFFADMYLDRCGCEVPDVVSLGASDTLAVICFQRVREETLSWLGFVSFGSTILAIGTMVIWSVLQICPRKES